MLNDKNIWVILIASAFIIISVFGYSVKAAAGQYVSGYMVLMDQKVSTSEYSVLGVKNFESIIYLPGESGEGIVTSCSFTFPSGVNEKADVTKDGRVDAVDIYLMSESFGCLSTNSCWNEAFNLEECYFTYADRQFKDPNEDCKIDQTDINLVSACYGKTTNPYGKTSECYKEDVNKDGKVDGKDVAIVSKNLGNYADTFKDYRTIYKRDLDLSDDGKIDGRDTSIVAKEYGQTATEQTCKTTPLEYVIGNQWRVRVSGRGLNYIGVSYRIIPV